jgi:hypothetical protein
MYIYKKIYGENIWRIGNDADNNTDRIHNLCAILKLIYPPKKRKSKTAHTQRSIPSPARGCSAVNLLKGSVAGP